MDMSMINQYALLVCAVSSLGVGLAAVGFDVLKMLQLNALRNLLQYVVLAAGCVSLYAYFSHMMPA